MPRYAAIAAVLIAPALFAEKLTFEDRVELTRGLTAEYAKAKALIPHSKKTLEFDASGTFNKEQWLEIAKDSGPAARIGDTVQITKVSIEGDRIVLDINGGFNGGKKWWRNIQIAGGASSNPTPVNLGRGDDPNANAPGGATIAILFHKPLEPMKAAAVKKLLAPVLDFDKHSVTEVYVEALPPETRAAIKEKRVLVGMDREQVLLALGQPQHKSREVKDGLELEDWVFGKAPGKFTFVTFNGEKVIQVKEMYAGLGTQTDPTRK